MISDTTPKNGRAMMYTSGWPKNQKRCCHRMAPPFSGLKMWPPKRRSRPSAKSAEASGGNAIMIRMPVMSVFQVKIGMRHIVMPGARIVRIVVMKLTPPMIVPKPWRTRPNTQRSPPTPGEYVVLESGA